MKKIILLKKILLLSAKIGDNFFLPFYSPERYFSPPPRQWLKRFSEMRFNAAFSSTPYFGRGAFLPESPVLMGSTRTFRPARSKIARVNSYQEQLPSAVAW